MKKILQHTALFSIFVFSAQILGLLRDLYLAKEFGVGQILDTYYLAFKIPDFLNVFYSVFLGSVIFIPLLTKLKNNGGEIEMQKKINSIGSLVFFFLFVVFALLQIFMPFLVSLIVPTWDTAQQQLLVDLSRILLVAQFFFPIGILGGSIGMINGKPFGMAFSGFIYNFGILTGALLLVPTFGVYGLAYSVIFGAVLFTLVQIWNKEVRKFFSNFRLSINISEWILFVKENLGRFFAVVAYQLYGIFLLSLASLSGEGGVSAFSIAYNIYLAVFFVLGASFSTVLMPKISEAHEKGENEKQKKHLRKNLFLIFIISLLAAICLFFLSQIIIKILYYYSNISAEIEIYIAGLLGMLAISFPFFNVLEVIRKYLYSTGQIFLAGSLTVSMLLGVGIFTYILKSFSTMPILSSLIMGMNISIFLSTIFILLVLKLKTQL